MNCQTSTISKSLPSFAALPAKGVLKVIPKDGRFSSISDLVVEDHNLVISYADGTTFTVVNL